MASTWEQAVMPTTALNHFNQDVGRARAIVTHADPLPQATAAEKSLRSDLLRSGWMFAVGAIDAYFCDAYTDVVASTINAKVRHPAAALPKFFNNIRFPVRAILAPYQANPGWRWRMAARAMMERENVLKLSVVKDLFNPFCRPGRKLFGEVVAGWIAHPHAKRRLFGVTTSAFAGLAGQARDAAVKAALSQFEERYRDIFQRRHDCIHNCDRPRVAVQPLAAPGVVYKVIEDAEFLVRRCDEHIAVELRAFLLGIGCPPAVVTQVGY